MNRDYDMDAHADVFIASKAGRMGYPNVLWRMTVADAQKVCSHPGTKGANWMLVWTTHSLIEPQWFAADDGRFDDLLGELGVTVLMSRKLARAGKVKADARPSQPKTPKSPAPLLQLDIFGKAVAS